MPLARVRKVGEEEVTLGGSLILDLPKLGWVQGGYDSFYGAAAGVGFNLNRRISLGYTMEKGLSNNFDNFGVTHEISFAYSFTPNLTEDRVLLEEDADELVNTELVPEKPATNEELAALREKLAENDAIIAELMFRQDSLEANRQRDLNVGSKWSCVWYEVRPAGTVLIWRSAPANYSKRAKKVPSRETVDTTLATMAMWPMS